jgi:hypothetical protein
MIGTTFQNDRTMASQGMSSPAGVLAAWSQPEFPREPAMGATAPSATPLVDACACPITGWTVDATLRSSFRGRSYKIGHFPINN